MTPLGIVEVGEGMGPGRRVGAECLLLPSTSTGHPCRQQLYHAALASRLCLLSLLLAE